MNKKKVLSIVLTSLVGLTLLSGCKKANQTTKSVPVKSDQPVEFSLYVNYDWFTPPKECETTKWIKENKKVAINFISANNAAQQKFSTMLVSDELPDVIQLDRGANVQKLIDAKKLVPLDPYLDKYPNLKKYFGEKNIDLLRSSDGKLYQFPNWFISGDKGNGSAGYSVNLKIYNELGAPKLETYDDLYNYLKKVKEKYPDVTPIDGNTGSGGFWNIYQGMRENSMPNSGFSYPSGNELKLTYDDPEYKAAGLFISKLYREKLLNPDALTKTKDQLKASVNNGKLAVGNGVDMTIVDAANSVLKAKDPKDGYMYIWPVHKAGLNKDNIKLNQFNAIGWNVNVITTKAKDPEGIFRYMDWLITEEGFATVFYGPKGVYYDSVDEKGAPITNDKYKNATAEEKKAVLGDQFTMAGNTTVTDTLKQSIEMKLPEEKRNFTTMSQMNVTFKTSINNTQFFNIDPDGTSDEGIILAKLKDMEKQVQAKLTLAKSDEDVTKILETASKDAKTAGADKLLKYWTAKWQENKKKLAIK